VFFRPNSEGKQVKIMLLISKLLFYLHLTSIYKSSPKYLSSKVGRNKKKGLQRLCKKSLGRLPVWRGGLGYPSSLHPGPQLNHPRQMNMTLRKKKL
jgi:hypothetical protein